MPRRAAPASACLQAAADEGILSIGVDSNQNYLHPGQVLTSMLKRVDNAVYERLQGRARTWKPAGEGAGPARPKASAMRWTTTTAPWSPPRWKTAVDAAAGKIKSGEIKVHDYIDRRHLPGR